LGRRGPVLIESARDLSKDATGGREDGAALGHAYYLLRISNMALGQTDDEPARLALPILEEAGDLVLQSNLLNNLGIEAYMWAAGTKPLSCTGGAAS
jgi:hypothetical protein